MVEEGKEGKTDVPPPYSPDPLRLDTVHPSSLVSSRKIKSSGLVVEEERGKRGCTRKGEMLE